jgi:hypothetical protein
MDRLEANVKRRAICGLCMIYRAEISSLHLQVTGNNERSDYYTSQLRKCIFVQDEALDSDFITFMTKVMM